MLNKKCFLLSTDVIGYMKKEKPQKTSENEGLSIDSLNTVIDANKDLYNELNALTELEAIEKISSEEEQKTTQRKITKPGFVIFKISIAWRSMRARFALFSNDFLPGKSSAQCLNAHHFEPSLIRCVNVSRHFNDALA